MLRTIQKLISGSVFKSIWSIDFWHARWEEIILREHYLNMTVSVRQLYIIKKDNCGIYFDGSKPSKPNNPGWMKSFKQNIFINTFWVLLSKSRVVLISLQQQTSLKSLSRWEQSEVRIHPSRSNYTKSHTLVYQASCIG